MKAESDELEQNVCIIRAMVVMQWWRLVGYHRCILCCEAGQVLGAEGRLDEHYDSVFCVKDAVKAIYVDEYGAGILCPSSIENVSI